MSIEQGARVIDRTNKRPISLLWGASLLALTAIAGGASATPSPVTAYEPASIAPAVPEARRPELTDVRSRLQGLSVPFVENRHSFDRQVAYWAPVAGGQVYVTREGGLVYQFGKAIADTSEADSRESDDAEVISSVLREHLVGADAKALKPRGESGVETRVSRYVGNDPARWDVDSASYGEIAVGEAWPGVNLHLRARSRSVEKVFTVSPGADVQSIRIAVDGAPEGLSVSTDGSLRAATSTGEVAFSAPIAWQPATVDLPERTVEVAYALDDRNYGFAVGDYDHSRPLVIDPLVRATYLGGTGSDTADADVAFGPNNTILVTGSTTSFDFPGISGPQRSHNANASNDIFVAQVSVDLTRIIAATYIGGSGNDQAYALAVRGSNLYVAGRTTSRDFPALAGGAQTTAAPPDGVIMRMPANLSGFTQATLFGGDGIEAIRAMRIADNGDIYVAGDTSFGTTLPGTAGGAQPTRGDSQANIDACNDPNRVCNIGDLFIARFNSTLTALRQATYFGGSAMELTRSGLAISPITGDIYAGGVTYSLDIPGTASGAQPANGNPTGDPDTQLETGDAFVGRFSADLRTRYQSSYFGGSGSDGLRELLVNPTTGDLYLSGSAQSEALPGLAGGAQTVKRAGSFAPYAARLNSTLTSALQSTYIGSDGIVRDLAISPVNNDLYAAGDTSAPNFTGTAGGAQNLINLTGDEGDLTAAAQDAFVSRLSPDLRTIRQSSYFGGSTADSVDFIALSDLLIVPNNGSVILYGTTSTSDLPATATGAQPASAGSIDAYLARFDATLTGVDTIADPFLITPVTGVPRNSLVTSTPVTVSGVVAPTAISVVNGAYSVNGGGFVSHGGAVNNGDQVRVQNTSSDQSLTAVSSTLTIGGQSADFTSTTGDASPTGFSFTTQTGVALGSVVTSNSIVVRGIAIPATISIGGDASSSYSVNGGAFVTTPGEVRLNDTVTVRHTAASSGNTNVISTLTIQDRSANFRSTTQNVDTNPDNFAFATVKRVRPSTIVTSEVITPTGYAAQAQVTISGGSGEYSVAGGAFTSAPGFISPGQSIQVRATSAATPATSTATLLTIGTTTGQFRTVTR